jgi:hypothetical protein
MKNKIVKLKLDKSLDIGRSAPSSRKGIFTDVHYFLRLSADKGRLLRKK